MTDKERLARASQALFYAWQMLAAICETDPSTDRIRARDAAHRAYLESQ